MDVALGSLSNELDRQAATARQRLMGLVALLLAGTGLGAWVMVVSARTTTRAAADALRLAEAVSRGDLQHGVQAIGRDEIGRLVQALDAMRRSLASVVHEVRGNAEQVALASMQIAQGNLDLSQRTENQAAALRPTAASMEPLQSTIQTNADNATEVHRLAREADARANSGHDVVRDVVARMRSIEESSREVQEIVGTIDGIAFQTNILALSAALVEESAAAADSLRQQADRLAQAVARSQLPWSHGEGAMA